MITRDLLLARRAKRHGANYSLRIVREARRAGIPISLGFALVEKESGFRNVFGHDPTTSIPNSWKGSEVTKAKYLGYKAKRSSRGFQGVGPVQLTWGGYQDQADRLGGCWIPKHNIRVGFQALGDLVKKYGLRDGCRRYNGAGPAAQAYAADLLKRKNRWHKFLS